MEIFRKLISGRYSLLTTFWLIAVPLGLIWKLIGRFGGMASGSMIAISYVATGIVLTVICSIAVWNSAGNYLGQSIWKWLARILCVPPLFVVVSLAFMFFSKSTVLTNDSDSECLLYWDDTKRQFTNILMNDESYKNLEKTYFVKKGMGAYHDSLYPQLLKADKEGNTKLAKSIASEIQSMSIIVYHDPTFPKEYIAALGKNHDISSKCN
jgi:hypothetical protein